LIITDARAIMKNERMSFLDCELESFDEQEVTQCLNTDRYRSCGETTTKKKLSKFCRMSNDVYIHNRQQIFRTQSVAYIIQMLVNL